MLDNILKIQNFTFRQLPSSKPLPVDVLSKNERIRDRLECARPIPDDLPQKLGVHFFKNVPKSRYFCQHRAHSGLFWQTILWSRCHGCVTQATRQRVASVGFR